MSSGPPTPKLGLHTYTDLDDFDYEEISEVNETIDELLPVFSCTSVTRPTTNLFDGRLIYETDTERVMRYNGSAWKRVTAGKYTDYTHDWSGPTVLTTGANCTAKYRQINDQVEFFFTLVRDAATNQGTTSYSWKLPVAGIWPEVIGTGIIEKPVGTYTPVYVLMLNATTMALARMSDGQRIANDIPAGAWAVNEKIMFRGSYRALASV